MNVVNEVSKDSDVSLEDKKFIANFYTFAFIGLLELTAGYCGTLMTPKAANFNIMPAALLETKSQNTVIKYQAPFAIVLLIIHILLMYFLGF